MRWIEEDGTMIYPDQFIPLFERNGFIIKLDEYMFRKACILQRSLLDRNIKPIPLAINQSRLNLANPLFHLDLKKIADEYEIPYNLLEIEVTEYIYSTEKDVMETLDKLKQVGFSVSIDDFGSGYSSLNILSNRSLDCIKIDKEFLRNKEITDNDKRAITSIVDISKALNVKCVCEGVETREQVDFLKDIKCDFLQGYYFSKPISLKKFIKNVYDIESEEFLNEKI